MNIDVRANVSGAIKHLSDIQRKQVPFATAKALTDVAKDVQDAVPGALESALHKPRPFTKRGTFRKPANKATLTAVVGFKDLQAAYLKPILDGGARPLKKLEKRTGLSKLLRPSKKARLDVYGNLPKKLSKAIQDASKELNTGSSAKRYFSGLPRGGQGLPAGIYARVDDNNRIVPLAVFMSTARYEKRFSLSALAARVVRSSFDARFQAALSRALASAR